MSALTAEKVATLDACFGTYPHTQALKDGAIKSDRVALRFTEVEPINKAFLMMVRQEKFDVSEMAIATYLQAKAYGKPLTLLPATMMGRFQHGTMFYNSERGTVTPRNLPGRRVGVRQPRGNKSARCKGGELACRNAGLVARGFLCPRALIHFQSIPKPMPRP